MNNITLFMKKKMHASIKNAVVIDKCVSLLQDYEKIQRIGLP